MKSNAFLLAALALHISAALAQAQQTPATPPTTASAEVMQCAQAQMVVDRLLSVANGKLETARQFNSATEMRAAVDELQATLRDVRAQLAPCANVQPAPDPHTGHPMPSAAAAAAPGAPVMKPGATAPPAATSKPAAADPHVGHVTAPAAPTAAKPAAVPTTKASPTPADPHAGHTTTTAKPAAPTKRPSTSAKPSAAAKPPAEPHAGHTMPPAKPAPATKKAAPPAPKPASPAKPPASGDPHAGHTPSKEPPATTANEQAEATDPVCGLKVDPKTAPTAQHQGRTYYFCSDQHRQLFSKNPAKYLPGQR
jgi:YHS domain-containing protein